MKYELLTAEPDYDGWTYRARITADNGNTIGINQAKDGRFVVFTDVWRPWRSKPHSRWCDGLLEAQSIAVEWLCAHD